MKPTKCLCRQIFFLYLALLAGAPARPAGKLNATQLIALAKSNPASLRDAIQSSFDEKDLKAGVAWAGRGPDFFFATEA